MTKENMIVLALCGVLLMVIALPAGGKKESEEQTESGQWDTYGAMMDSEKADGAAVGTGAGREAAGTGQDSLEGRLEEFLSGLEGAGQVRVMLTYAASEERIVEKDAPADSVSQTSENDSAGGSRSISSRERRESTVYATDREGGQTPYVTKTLAARVEGVTVLAQGGGSRAVQKEITDMIEALFGIEAHKIKVAKLASGQGAQGAGQN